MDWDKLKTFHAAAEAGSLTGAADSLLLSQSAVSRQLAALEDVLGVKLFHRHARGLIPTEPGRLLHEITKEIAAKVALARSVVDDSHDNPSGDLRVTAPTALGAIWLAPRIAKFREAYPDIRVHLLLDDHEFDIAGLEADCAIRPWESTQNDVIQRKLLTARQHLFASQEYLDREGVPGSADALDDHQIIRYGPPQMAPIRNLEWAAGIGRKPGDPPRPAVMEANTIYAIVKAVESGIGIAGLPDYVTRGHDTLVRVLPDLEGPSFDVYFVYPGELRGSSRLSVFRDFLLKEAKEWES
ncbi:MAG: LysR family transcriptional regulator [Maricaulis sp.]|jgi:DNA-binding transcriptional LysR family regulator|nr:LysR family transcriptional regulator [Maricaulis sp.]HAQ33763.1 LysR family transcriptional regulator [Alphaproteobacteria bacterium]